MAADTSTGRRGQREPAGDQAGELIARALAPRASEATLIEIEQVIAEVQGAIIVAQRVPRVVPVAEAAMRESCGHLALAERAFYAYPRGKNPDTGKPNIITGASIHLARELARVWGNVQYGIRELRRDDVKGESEMSAWAWDVQTNTRPQTTFIVPHGRFSKGVLARLDDPRDVYENNANVGARRVREQIFAILPAWFTEEAKELCRATREREASKIPLGQQVANAVTVFGNEFAVSREQLEAQRGKPAGQWTQGDMTQLQVLLGSLRSNELTVSEAFGQVRPAGSVSPGDIRRQQQDEAAEMPAPGETPPAAETVPPEITLPDDFDAGNHHRWMHALFASAGVGRGERELRLAVSRVLARPGQQGPPLDIRSANDLEPLQLHVLCTELQQRVAAAGDGGIRPELEQIAAQAGWVAPPPGGGTDDEADSQPAQDVSGPGEPARRRAAGKAGPADRAK